MKYLAATGRIRALESRLIDYPRFQRIMEAGSADDALKELGDTDYAGGMSDLSGPGEFEKLLARQDRTLYKLFSDLTENPAVTELFFLRNDFYNLKVALKEKLDGAGDIPEESFTGPAKYAHEVIVRAVQEDSYKLLEGPLKEAAAIAGALDGAAYQEVDLVLDRIYFMHASGVLEKYKNAFLLGLLRKQIDLVNIRTFIRLKQMGADRSVMGKYFINGGCLETALYMKAVDGSLDDFTNSLKFKDYYKTVKLGIEFWNSKNDFSIFEKAADDHITEYASRAKYITSGIEPLIGYFFAKKAEATNIRVIMTGKLNRLPEDTIKQRIRKTYI